jgi:hypothetical protein
MQAIECGLAAPFAQHAWSPANALDATSIAAETKVVMLIFFMVSAEVLAKSKPFNVFRVDYEDEKVEKRRRSGALQNAKRLIQH